MSNTNLPEPSPNGGKQVVGILILLGLLAVVVAVVLPAGKPPKARVAPLLSASTNSPAPASTGGFAALVGRWYRADGGYVLEIKQAGADGKLEAAYLNPRPINVAKAEARQEGSIIKVTVELRDTGYPGCLYTLLYDQPKDTLRGTYFQAALSETFDVTFERLKE
jgi:hypothetical protein